MWKGVLFVDICNTFSNKQRETELVKLFKILKFWARQVNEDDPMNHTYTLEVWCRVNALIKKLHNDVTNCGGVPWWNGGLISLMCLSAKTSWLDALFPHCIQITKQSAQICDVHKASNTDLFLIQQHALTWGLIPNLNENTREFDIRSESSANRYKSFEAS